MRIPVYIFLLGLLPLTVNAVPRVVTSIQPVYEITATIMLGVSKPGLLIRSSSSAHHFAFKPSHFRLLNEADLVIWVDRFFEDGFQRLPQIIRPNTVQLELLRIEELESKNGHIWYSPVKLVPMVRIIQRALSKLDPVNGSLYEANADKLLEDIRKWHELVKVQLKTYRPVYVLDHDFLGEFELNLGIEAVAVLHDLHDQAGGIGELQQIEKTILLTKSRCLLTNTTTASKLGQNLAHKYGLRIYNLNDSNSMQSGHSAFMSRLYRVSDTLRKCH